MRHGDIWRGLDELASRHGLSTSGLAKLAGLDATAFNKSKRQGKDGRLRWPSTESLSRVLDAVNEDLSGFAALVTDRSGAPLPIIRLDEVQAGNVLDANGCLDRAGQNAAHPILPGLNEQTFVLEVTGPDFHPHYQSGDRLVVAPQADLVDGKRVLVKTSDHGLVLATVIRPDPANEPSFAGLIDPDLHLLQADVMWASRILWRSQ